jgi:hypothetical protein
MKTTTILHDHFGAKGGHQRWWAPIYHHFRLAQHNVLWADDWLETDDIIARSGDGPVQVITWNGSWCERAYADRATLKAAGIPVLIAEVGWFPQKYHVHLDTEGINAESSLMRSLPEVESKVQDLNYVKSRYYGSEAHDSPDGHVLVVGQYEQDTNLITHAPYPTNQEFVFHCAEKFRGINVTWRPHPRTREQVRIPDHWKRVPHDEESIADAIRSASFVYAQNSTVLLEAALLGVEAEAIGAGLFKQWSHCLDHLVAALLLRQIHISAKNIDHALGCLEGQKFQK